MVSQDKSNLAAGFFLFSEVSQEVRIKDALWDKEGMEEGRDEDFLSGVQLFAQEGTWWELILSRIELLDAALITKVNATKTDVI